MRNIKFRIIASRAKRAMRRWQRWITIEIRAVITQSGIRDEGIKVIDIVLGEDSLFLIYKIKAYYISFKYKWVCWVTKW